MKDIDPVVANVKGELLTSSIKVVDSEDKVTLI